MTVFIDTLTGRRFDLDPRRSRIIEQALLTGQPPELAGRIEVDVEATWQQDVARSAAPRMERTP